jgi:hypothetical protein
MFDEGIAYNDMLLLADRLKEYAQLSNDEVGEICMQLIGLAQSNQYLSAEMQIALFNEMQEQLEGFEANWEIVPHEETFTRTRFELEMK